MTLEDPTAVTTVRHDWAGDEAALPGAWAEVARLGRRARRRWLRTLLYALGCSALAVLAVARNPPGYVSRVVLRASEGAGRAAPRDLAARVVATSARFAALGAALDVEVWPPARVALTLHGGDAQKVHDDVAELGRLVVNARPDPRQHVRPLRWELIDSGHLAPPRPGRAILLGLVAALAFLVALPLCAAAVGAFDPRVYDLDDVERLGVSTLGAVRRFDGDNAGALAARLSRGRIEGS